MTEWKKQFEGKYLTIGGILYKMRTVQNPDGTYNIAFDKVHERGPRPQPMPRDPERTIDNVPF